MVIAYEATSFLVAQAVDAASVEALGAACAEHFGSAPEVKVELSESRLKVATLAQIEGAERKLRLDAARRAVAEHPLVAAAVELLGAELRDVKLGPDLVD